MGKRIDGAMLASMAIREELKKARKDQGYTQKTLSDECKKHGYPIEQSDISDYERGTGNPSLDRIDALAKVLKKDWKLV